MLREAYSEVQLTGMHSLETLERLIRRGMYRGALNITWVGIGGGFDGPIPYNFMKFIRRAPDGACLTLESLMKNVLPIMRCHWRLACIRAAPSRTRSWTSTQADDLGAAG